jgi:tRNA C32,U32 (ribose-2'-O)-methylase TrmJ
MNLGQAVAVCLYELARSSKRIDKAAAEKAAGAANLERLTDLLAQILRTSGYARVEAANSFGEDIRRMVRRLRLSETDAQLWLGMVRQILWKIRAVDTPPSR